MSFTAHQIALARAAMDPTSALEAAAQIPYDAPPVEVVAGVLAPERVDRIVRERALTIAVEVDPPPEHSRWRFLVFYLLVRLAARVYPFKFEIYRTRQPWE